MRVSLANRFLSFNNDLVWKYGKILRMVGVVDYPNDDHRFLSCGYLKTMYVAIYD